MISFAAAISFAVTPADRHTAVHNWEASGDLRDAGVYVHPIVLTGGSPQNLKVASRCVDHGFTSDPTDGIEIVLAGNELSLSVRDSRLGTWELERPCRYQFVITTEEWELHLDEQLAAVGDIPAPYVTSHLRLDTRSDAAIDFQASLTTQPHRLSPSPGQILLLLIAGSTASAALILASLDLRTKDRSRERGFTFPDITSVDLLVFTTVCIWAVVGPALYDDGWVSSQLESYEDVGGFSAYYSSGASELPFGYWIGLIQLAVVAPFEMLIGKRLWAVGLILAGWFVVRKIFNELIPSVPGHVRFVAAALYLIGVLAWNMTLRPEPMVALLSGLVLLEMVRFRREPGHRPLLAALVFAALALLSHPIGIVALAPILASLDSIVRWTRIRRRSEGWPRSLSALLLGVGSLATLLFFLDSDLQHKIEAASTFRALGDQNSGPLTEISRYTRLGLVPYSPAVRRGFVSLMLIAGVLGLYRFTVRRRERPHLPSLSLVIALGLLTLTPSKWPWHFGALVVLAAVAFAVETAETVDRRRSILEVATITLGIGVAGAWAWRTAGSFNQWDLRTLVWQQGGVEGLGIDLSNPFLWIGAGVGLLLLSRTPMLKSIPSAPAVLMSCSLALTLIVVTAGTFVVDAAKTPGWTLARQNAEAVLGNRNCGLGDETLMPKSATALAVRGASIEVPDRVSPRVPFGRLSLVRSGATGGDMSSRWHTLGDATYVGVPVWDATRPQKWQLEFAGSLHTLEPTSPNRPPGIDSEGWTIFSFLVPSESLGEVRLVLEPGANPDNLGLGRLQQLEMIPVSSQVWTRDKGILVHPDVREYFPCVVQPTIRDGVAKPPDAIIDRWGLMSTFEPLRESHLYVTMVPPEGQLATVLVKASVLQGQ